MKKIYLSLLVVAFNFQSTNLFSQSWNEASKTVAPERGERDYFGAAVAIFGDFAIIGSTFDSKNYAGNDSLKAAGSAYIYKRNNLGSWEKDTKITPNQRTADDRFGTKVAISGDYAAVSSTYQAYDIQENNFKKQSGAVYIYDYSLRGVWIQIQKVVASDRNSDDFFGGAIAMSGNYLVVGAGGEDEDANGGNRVEGSGSAYIFERNQDGFWVEIQKIVASDRAHANFFGGSISISGDYIIVGTDRVDDDIAGENTFNEAGAAYIFEKNQAGFWIEKQKIVASDRYTKDYFGRSVSIFGNHAIVGAPSEDDDANDMNTVLDAGSAYIFERDGSGNWTEQQKIVASDRGTKHWFGTQVGITNNHAVVSSFGHGGDAGAAYVFKHDGSGNWTETQLIKSSDGVENDWFGNSMAISENRIIAGATGQAFDATGENKLRSAGAAYIFEAIPTAAIGNELEANNVQVFPNPATQIITIKLAGNSEFQIYNLLGKKITTQSNITSTEYQLDISTYAEGVYFLEVSNKGHKTELQSFAVKR